MTYGDFKDLAKRTASDKELRDKAFNFAKNLKYDGCQCGLVSTAQKRSDIKTTGTSIHTEAAIRFKNYQLAEESRKQIIGKFKKI